jgi:hypothetical protein
LVWCRQHGDEPLCAAALLNTLSFLLATRSNGAARDILDGATLFVIPAVNPDGVQRFTRRNAQGIDLNRDARVGATPEANVLLRSRDEFQPLVAFNLHDMAPASPRPTRNAWLRWPSRRAPRQERRRQRGVKAGKALCARMAEAVGRYAHGHVTRYDAPSAACLWRCHDEPGNLTCLIESGGWWELGATEFMPNSLWLFWRDCTPPPLARDQREHLLL